MWPDSGDAGRVASVYAESNEQWKKNNTTKSTTATNNQFFQYENDVYIGPNTEYSVHGMGAHMRSMILRFVCLHSAHKIYRQNIIFNWKSNNK